MTLRPARPASPITAVIVTFQSAKTIARALAAARRCHEAGLLDTVVVDNGSTDATQQILEREARWACVLLSGRNNGFGRGCNIGFAHVTSPYTLFLNPDAVVEPEALQTMLRFMDDHADAGIVGPAIIEGEPGAEGEFQVTGERPTPAAVLRSALPWPRARAMVRPIVPGSEAQRTGWVCGAVFMIRTELMRQLHGFDPRFFLYWEETDVCQRAAQEGFETWAVGRAVAHHVGGASSSPDDDERIGGCIARHYFQSRHYYLRKHHGKVAAVAVELGEFVLLALRAGIDAVRGQGWVRLKPRLQAPLMSLPEET